MLKISWIELLVKGFPEGFLSVLSIYIFTNTKFNRNKYILLSILMTICTYLIRLLPISLGVNTMLSLLILIILFIILGKAEPQAVIKSVIIMAIFLFVSEGINSLILYAMFGMEKAQTFVNDPTSKSLSSIPSTIIFAVIVLVTYFVLKNRRANKKVKDGEVRDSFGE